MKILLVEDDATFRRALVRLLEEAGHTVCYAPRFSDAMLHLVNEKDLDIVLLDIILGENELTGLDVARAMREHEVWRRIPIIVTSTLRPTVVRTRASTYAFDGLKCVMLEKTDFAGNFTLLLETMVKMVSPLSEPQAPPDSGP